jgi:archaetidylinositol phosphate synthase
MPLLQWKIAIEAALAPLARQVPLSPNTITLLGVIVMAGASAAVWQGHWAWAGALVLLSGTLDLLDGAVAKAQGLSSRYGALLDRVADRVADFLILAALILASRVPAWAGLLAVALVFLGSYISACLEAMAGAGIGEALSLRAVRIVVVALGCVVAEPLAAIVVLAMMGAWSVLQRLLMARALLAGLGAPHRPGSVERRA